MNDKDKEAADKAKRERQPENRIDNRDQDPHHPANVTQSRYQEPVSREAVPGVPVPPAEMMTEQEKDAQAGGAATEDNIPGVGPATSSDEPVEGPTIEDQGIGPRTPYPTGDPPPPDESVTRYQGIKRDTPPHNEPNKPLAKERR